MLRLHEGVCMCGAESRQQLGAWVLLAFLRAGMPTGGKVNKGNKGNVDQGSLADGRLAAAT